VKSNKLYTSFVECILNEQTEYVAPEAGYPAQLYIIDDKHLYQSRCVRCKGAHQIKAKDGVIEIVVSRCLKNIKEDHAPRRIKTALLFLDNGRVINVAKCEPILNHNSSITED